MDNTWFTSFATLSSPARFLAQHIHQFHGILTTGGEVGKWLGEMRVRAEQVRSRAVSSDIGLTEAERQRAEAEVLKRAS